MGPVHRADRDAELAMVRTNVEAVVDLCTLFVPGMVTRHRGAVLNTASTAAFQPLPGQAGYGASKAFVLSYGRALGAELRGTGVTVTTLCPGPGGDRLRRGGRDDRRRGGRDPARSSCGCPAADVATAAVDGLAAGRPVVIPGAANRTAAVARPPRPQVAAPAHDGAAPPGAEAGRPSDPARTPARPPLTSPSSPSHDDAHHYRGPMPQPVSELTSPLPRHGGARAPGGHRRHRGGAVACTGWPAPSWATR